MLHLFQLEIIFIAMLACIACALPGILLVLNGTALMSDAISHSILPGIVIMFLVIQNLESPLLLLGAGLAGIATVMVTQRIIQTERLKKDAAIGLVFPLFFSVGVLLITVYARNMHLDTDMVLLGELAFAPFHRVIVAGYDSGAYNMWVLIAMVTINAAAVFLFLKEFIIGIFDPLAARTYGINPKLFFYSMMCLTSFTCVTAFESVGSLVVVALMIAPVASALLVCTQINTLIVTTLFFSLLAAINGYLIALLCNLSIAGCIAASNGALFLYAWLFAPHKGIIAQHLNRKSTGKYYTAQLICSLLEKNDSSFEQLQHRLCLSEKTIRNALIMLIDNNYISSDDDTFRITQQGRSFASLSTLA